MNLIRIKLSLTLLFLIIGCSQESTQQEQVIESVKSLSKKVQIPPINNLEEYPGGQASVSNEPFPSLMKLAANLPEALKPDFYAGKALAHQPWIKAPTATTARDGLGPLYNARTCLACHINGGRGKMPDNDSEVLFSGIVRLSIPGNDKMSGVKPEPVYGDQLQTQSVSLVHQLRSRISQKNVKNKEVKPEAYVYVNWINKTFVYPDKQTLTLRYPKLNIQALGYGPLDENTLMSVRVAPPIHGMGLLEAIEQKDINANADPDDLDNDGISGRVNWVWNFEIKQSVPGRFGLKANKPDIRHQTAAAFLGDVGISNPVFPNQNCSQKQVACQKTINGNDQPGDDGVAVELPESLLTLVTNFGKNIGVPKRREFSHSKIQEGRAYFFQAGCQQCHTPSYVTGTLNGFPHLSGQTIWPYTDLLLHDMGDELTDNRPDYLATGNEWRTPPLWSVGLREQVNGSNNLLHDGRARTVEEAIIWHGGEAEKSKRYFINLERQQRDSLLAFVKSL